MSSVTSIPALFDSICFECGEKDAIIGPDDCGFVPICYTELQQSSMALACQLHHRYRPTYCLLELKGVAAAEAVSMLACMRIGVPFVPVSVMTEQHSGERLGSIVTSLRSNSRRAQIVAIVLCDDDKDPILPLFYSVNIHNIVYVNSSGDLREPMNVSDSLPSHSNDDLYVLFTSGTSGETPKAVIGSSQSTLRRLQWFAKEFPSERGTVIARRSKLTFVDSISEMLSALLFPPAVLYAMDQQDLASRGIASILDTPCTRVTMLPSQLSQLLLLCPPPSDHVLDTIVVSGEPCPASILVSFKKHFPTTKLINLYGQTESTGDVLCAVLTDMDENAAVVDNVVAVGKPIPGVSVSLSTKNELIVSGNLSNGYLNSTSKAPFTTFSTGDVGFCRNGGCWYVTGRLDDVAKINGIVTSPAEVEAVFGMVYSVPCAASIVNNQVYVLVEKKLLFSRETMREAGVPWNLIPKGVFKAGLLPRSGGAGKLDRSGVKKIVEAMVATDQQFNSGSGDDQITAILSDVLGVAVDNEKSFVEMGGDSALAVTLLYRLRAAGQVQRDITARHILEADTIREFRGILSGERKVKRQKESKDTKSPKKAFVVKERKSVGQGHVAFEFEACVDAAPLVYGTDIYGACQGGIIQRIVKGTEVTAHYALGYSVQADLLVVGTSIIACGYNAQDDSGIIVAMSLDLSSVRWSRHVKGTIKSSPVQVNTLVFVVAGSRLHVINPQDGSEVQTVELPSCTESKPAVVTRDGSLAVVYAFSDWDAGLAIVESKGLKVTTLSEISSPVYADLLDVGGTSVIVGDILGFLHNVNITTLDVKSKNVSNKPIFSGPVITLDGNIVFGCHDGVVRCVNPTDFTTCWEFETLSVVYSKPLVTATGSVVICTTAGEIIIVLEGGKERWRTKVDGEVWSEPVGLDNRRIVVGARDSKLHVLTLG